MKDVTEVPGFVSRVAELITPGLSIHHGHTPEIGLTGPTSATGIWAMEDYVTTDDNSNCFRGYGHYQESYAKQPDGRWLISSWRLTRLRVDRLSKSQG